MMIALHNRHSLTVFFVNLCISPRDDATTTLPVSSTLQQQLSVAVGIN